MIIPILFLILTIGATGSALVDIYKTKFKERETKTNVVFLVIVIPFVGAIIYYMLKESIKLKKERVVYRNNIINR